MPGMKDGFVPLSQVEGHVKRFLRGYGKRLADQTDKIAYFCQMTAYNAYVRYYRDELGWSVFVKQTKNDKFRYKLQPTGNPHNYSFFELSKDGETIWVLNNVQVESAHDAWHFFAPDIVVSRAASIISHKAAIARKVGYERTVYSVKNADLVTFGEVKNIAPYPELLFSFQGLVFELMPEVFFNRMPLRASADHPAPALLCSFEGSRHAKIVLHTLESRFRVNVLTRFLTFKRLPPHVYMVSATRRRPKSGKNWVLRRRLMPILSGPP